MSYGRRPHLITRPSHRSDGFDIDGHFVFETAIAQLLVCLADRKVREWKDSAYGVDYEIDQLLQLGARKRGPGYGYLEKAKLIVITNDELKANLRRDPHGRR